MREPARELFRDAAFPASDSSLFSSFSTPLAQFREEITWRRPQEICATPRLFADNPQEGQVKQGLLGDCWFLCACAALQKSQHLRDQVPAAARVFPPGQPSWLERTYRGSFTCRVWQFGHWVEVTIDDRLPCLAGRLCFSRCQREDVFWLPLLEKVYAKYARQGPGGLGGVGSGPREARPLPLGCRTLIVSGFGEDKVGVKGEEGEAIEVGQKMDRGGQKRGWGPRAFASPAPGCLPRVHGSYEHLWAGQVADALVDLTGGLAERWNLKDLARTSGHQDRPVATECRTCRQLLGLKDRCLLSCSVLSPRTGEAGGRWLLPRGPVHNWSREEPLVALGDPGVCAAMAGWAGAARARRQSCVSAHRGAFRAMTSRSHPGSGALGSFHAFIVSDLRELRGRAGQSILLLRIQNPWGRRCWQGPWREGGEGWSQVDAADRSELLSQLQEGEFWVEEEEFLREFDEVTIGYPVTEAGHLQSLYSGKALCHTQALPGAWVKGQSAGGCRNNSGFPSNPKFWLRVSEPSEVYVALLQRRGADGVARVRAPVGGPTSFPGKDYQAVGLHVWKVEKRRVSLPRALSAPPVAGTVCHAYDREVHLRCELAPGYYLAVPSTFLKDVPGRFLLRVFSSGRVSLSAIKPAAQSPAHREAPPAGEWETVRLRGSWRVGRTAGGSRNFASYPTNPCFPLSVPEGTGPRCVRITLRQHCQDSKCHPIGFHVFQAGSPCSWGSGAVRQDGERVPADGGGLGAPSLLLQEPLLSCVPHCYTQEVSRLCHLSAGTYRIVPSTYLPDTEGAFTVTVETRIDRRSIHSQEMLGQLLQEASFMAVMKKT
ncbi:Calpain-10 [Camelus dromedarius]|uniref:Calpain-10 n=1 Tax=Camelus dromedarius TaxID=9838 RepID=A0A5N4E6Y1_CAMDR|nr:Calpain-10 [Camelus dromedarius]